MPSPRLKPLLAATAVAIAALAFVTGCYEDDSTGPNSPGPRLSRILLTDAPFPYDSVSAVEIFIESIAASESSDTTGLDEGDWVTVATPRRAVDLLELQNGETELLGEGQLPAGKYRAIRMVIKTAASRIVGVHGNEVQVNWQSSAGQPTLYALVEGGQMDVPENGANIVIDFDVGRSFLQEYPGGPFTFLPWLRAVNEAATGSITGSVQASLLNGGSAPVPNATITVFRGAANADEGTWSVAATARTDAQGRYKVAFLMPDNYIVRAEAPGVRQLPGTTEQRLFHADTRTGTSVAQGIDTPLSFTLTEIDHSFFGISSGRFVLTPGDTTDLDVVVTDAHGRPLDDPAVSWTSTNPAVATVIGNGRTARVAALAVGRSDVIARSGEMADTVPITVTTDTTVVNVPPPPTGPVASVSITPARLGVTVGDSATFVATPRTADGQPVTGSPVAWSVSDSTVAYFMSAPSGPPYAVLRTRARGAVTVTAVCEGKSATATLTVQ